MITIDYAAIDAARKKVVEHRLSDGPIADAAFNRGFGKGWIAALKEADNDVKADGALHVADEKSQRDVRRQHRLDKREQRRRFLVDLDIPICTWCDYRAVMPNDVICPRCYGLKSAGMNIDDVRNMVQRTQRQPESQPVDDEREPDVTEWVRIASDAGGSFVLVTLNADEERGLTTTVLSTWPETTSGILQRVSQRRIETATARFDFVTIHEADRVRGSRFDGIFWTRRAREAASPELMETLDLTLRKPPMPAPQAPKFNREVWEAAVLATRYCGCNQCRSDSKRAVDALVPLFVTWLTENGGDSQAEGEHLAMAFMSTIGWAPIRTPCSTAVI